ncbi:unnamed protein product [Closterium sp. NIES-53]
MGSLGVREVREMGKVVALVVVAGVAEALVPLVRLVEATHEAVLGPTGGGPGAVAWYIAQQWQQSQEQQPQQGQPQLTDCVRAQYGFGPGPDSRLLALVDLLCGTCLHIGSLPVASVALCLSSLGACVAALGACVATRPGAPPAEVSLSFTQESGASQCFFRDHTTLTPLLAPLPVARADPSSGPAVARSSTTLPCPVVPSGVLRGLHIPSFTRNLVDVGYLQDRGIVVTFVGGGRTAVCTDAVTRTVLATFTREPRSGLYVLHTKNSRLAMSTQVAASPQVAVSGQVALPGHVATSGQVATSCSCRSLSHPTVLWHHHLGHPSIPRLRSMASHRLVSGLPRVFASLPPSPAPLCTPCIASRLRATPHSSSLCLATTPFQTLHLDVTYTLIRWLLATEGTRGSHVSCLHSDNSPDYTFYHPPLHHFLDSRDVCFDESVSYYARYPYRGLPVPPPPLFLAPSPLPAPAPPVPPPPPSPALSAGDAAARGTRFGGALLRGVGVGGASLGGAGAGGAGTSGASSGGAGAGGAGAEGGAGAVGAGEAGAAAVGPAGAAGAAPAAVPAAAAAAAPSIWQLFPPVSGLRALGLPSSSPVGSQSPLAFGPSFPPPDDSLAVWSSPQSTSRPPVVPHYRVRPCPPRARPSSPVTDLRTALLCSSRRRSPPVSVLPSPPLPSLPVAPTPISNYYYTSRHVVSRVLASLVAEPRASPPSVSALTAAVCDFVVTRHLDYAMCVVATPPSRPLSVGGEFALGCDILEDRPFELEFLAAAFPSLCAMLLSLEGDPDALDIPTPRTCREAVSEVLCDAIICIHVYLPPIICSCVACVV